jgi:hypothetical protein
MTASWRPVGAAEAVEAALAVARHVGIRVDSPVVLAESHNVLVRLDPAPIVARVMAGVAVRPLARAVESLRLAAWLADHGAPVARPTREPDPGPYMLGPWPVSLWELVEIDGAVDPAEAGRSLRLVHGIAEGYDGELSRGGRVPQIRAIAAEMASTAPLESDGLLTALGAIEAQLPDLSHVPRQAIHGDAHLWNVLPTRSGPRWADWEEAWRGPVAWDIASLEHRRLVFGEYGREISAALEAYGPYDAATVAAFAPLVTAWAAALGLLYGLHRDPASSTSHRLAWLRARYGLRGDSSANRS